MVLFFSVAACVGDDPTKDTGGAADASPDDSAAAGDGGTSVAMDGSSSADASNDAPPVGSPSAPTGVTASPVAILAPVTTLAGSPGGGHVNGNGVGSSFLSPRGMATDAAGNVYVGDALNDLVRKVTPTRDVTTFAGIFSNTLFAEGPQNTATFNQPNGVAVDAAGNVYVADQQNHRIRKITPAGVTSTLAGSGTATFMEGTGTAASFNSPAGVAVDATGNVYVADGANNRIRKITALGVTSTLAGSGAATPFANGTGAAATFSFPNGVAVDVAGNVFVADPGNNRIRKITAAGAVTTLAGSATGASAPFADGTGAMATFNFPRTVALDGSGNVYVADALNHRIRRVTSAGVVTTLAGAPGNPPTPYVDGASGIATFNNPQGVALDSNGQVFVGDQDNKVVRKIAAVGIGQLTVIWGVPGSTGTSAITDYTASASAAGHPTKTCTTTGPTTCTIGPLVSGVVYSVSVTATNAAGTSAPSAASPGVPN